MSQMEERLNAILGNRQLMEQIASMAQAMGKTEEQKEPPAAPALDPRLLQVMSQTLGQTGVDGNQRALLQALEPFVSPQRVHKLERAMQAARMAGAASAFLNAGGLQMLSGR